MIIGTDGDAGREKDIITKWQTYCASQPWPGEGSFGHAIMVYTCGTAAAIIDDAARPVRNEKDVVVVTGKLSARASANVQN
jgi:hypothetical protein